MSNVEITIKLPEELIERAQAVGLRIDDQLETITEAIEREIRRREAQNPELIENQLAEMAADPEIQREIRQIQDEFAGTDSDGLLSDS